MDFQDVFYDSRDFELTDTLIGKGTFGKVYIVKRLKDNSQFAIKMRITNTEEFNGREQMLFMRESMILHKLSHPGIVKLYGINFQSFTDPTRIEPSLITELLTHGSLKKILDNEKKGLSDRGWNPTKKYICLLGIANAMQYLHKNGIMHRDLKPENILTDDEYYPRICDFGLSRCFPSNLTKSLKLTMSGTFGTPLYMAPELLEGEEQCTSSIDVYAFAFIAYEIMSGKEPFENYPNKNLLFKHIIDGNRPDLKYISSEKMKKLISLCWDNNSKIRPSFEEIFQKLSTDFSYSDEDVDNDEVNEYIEMLKESQKNDNNLLNEYLNIEKNKFEQVNNINQLFHSACQSNDLKLIELLLSKESIDINYPMTYYYGPKKRPSSMKRSPYFYQCTKIKTPLHIAVENQNIEIIKLLLKNKNIDVNIKVKQEIYSEQRYEDENRRFQQRNQTYEEYSALHIAIDKRNADIVILLLSANEIDINASFDYFYRSSPAGPDCWRGFGAMGLEEFKKGPPYQDYDYTDTMKTQSALHIAVEKGYTEIVNILIKHGIEVDILNFYYTRFGVNPCDYDIKHYYTSDINSEYIKRLNEYKSNFRFKENMTANYLCCSEKCEKKAPLHIAVEKENIEIIHLLINIPFINSDIEDHHGKTPMQLTTNELIINLLK